MYTHFCHETLESDLILSTYCWLSLKFRQPCLTLAKLNQATIVVRASCCPIPTNEILCECLTVTVVRSDCMPMYKQRAELLNQWAAAADTRGTTERYGGKQ